MSATRRPAGRARLARVRGRVARLPRALWAVALVAVLHAATWAVLTPAFQAPDEPAHTTYAAYLAENGSRPPRLATLEDRTPAPVEGATLETMPFTAEGPPGWSGEQDRLLDRALEGVAVSGGAGGTTAWSNPPLFYALEAGLLLVAEPLEPLDRLQLMRWLSALFAGLTAAFTFLFLRELLPGSPRAWTVGALAVALQPVLGFISGAVTPDGLLFALSAAALWLMARLHRRGLSRRRVAGLVLAVGAAGLTKAPAIALVPAAAVLLAHLRLRGLDPERRRAWRRRLSLAGAALVVLGFAALFVPAVPKPSAVFAADSGATPLGQLSYLWQTYLPVVPGMDDVFDDPEYPLWGSLVTSFWGRFGWFQYGFPAWGNAAATVLLGAVIVLAVRAIRARAGGLRGHRAHLAAYVVGLAALAVVIAAAGYRYRLQTGNDFEQVRYLFPFLPLYGALVALAVRGAGSRFGPALGSLLVTLAGGHVLLAQLLTVDRYYL